MKMKNETSKRRNVPKLAVVALGCMLGMSAIAWTSSSAFADVLNLGPEPDPVVTDYLGADAVRDILLAEVPGATINELELERSDGIVVYEGEMFLDEMEYEFMVDAVTGAILKWTSENNSESEADCDDPEDSDLTGGDPSLYIGEAAATQILLDKVPGATISEIELSYDDGKAVYEGEMYEGDTVYEFVLDAVTGEIIVWESDVCEDDEAVTDGQDDAADDAADAAEDAADEADEETDN